MRKNAAKEIERIDMVTTLKPVLREMNSVLQPALKYRRIYAVSHRPISSWMQGNPPVTGGRLHGRKISTGPTMPFLLANYILYRHLWVMLGVRVTYLG